MRALVDKDGKIKSIEEIREELTDLPDGEEIAILIRQPTRDKLVELFLELTDINCKWASGSPLCNEVMLMALQSSSKNSAVAIFIDRRNAVTKKNSTITEVERYLEYGQRRGEINLIYSYKETATQAYNDLRRTTERKEN